jgi:hypothetical protein
MESSPTLPACWVSCSELARYFGVNAEQFRQRLRKLMADDPDSYVEVQDPGTHEPRLLYSFEKARPLAEALRGRRRGNH